MERSARLVAVSTALVVLLGCTSNQLPSTNVPSPGRTPTHTPAHTPATSATPDPLAARTQAEIDVPGGPDLPVAAFGSLWLVAPDGEVANVTRIDPATNEIVATIALEANACQALGASDEAMWTCASGGLARIDPLTNQIEQVVDYDLATTLFFGYLPFGAGSLWSLGGDGVARNQVIRIDPMTNEVAMTYELEFDASWISFGEGALWLTDTTGGTLWRLDPASGAITVHTSDLPGPGPSTVGAGSVWLSVRTGPDDRPTANDVTLVRIEPTSGDVVAEIVLGGSIGEIGLYADGDAVWVRTVDPFLARVDPATNQVAEVLQQSALGGTVTVGFDSVWATSYRLNRVWRIEP